MLCRLICALLFLAWTAERPIDEDPALYSGYWRSPLQVFGPLFVSLPGLHLYAWQALLLALAPLCLLLPGAFRGRAWAMDAAIVTSLSGVALTFLWGWLRGGSPYNAYYQLWRFLTALLVGIMLISAIRRGRDLRAVALTVVTAALVRSALAIYFYWAVVRDRIDPPPPHMTTHDDSLLFVAGLLVLLTWAISQRGLTTRLTATLASAVVLYAMVLNNRRIAWIDLLLSVATLYLLLPRGKLRRRVNRLVLVLAPIAVLYVIVGWGRSEALFEPLRAFSTAGSSRDASSLARQEEIRNLLYTLSTVGNPLLGTGWGVPYVKVSNTYSNYGPEWWQHVYTPHNSLLGLAVFGGFVGISGIWLVVPVAAFLAARGCRRSLNGVDRGAAMVACAVLPAYAAQCYGDLGLHSLTCGLILGVAVAVAGKVAAWCERGASRVQARPALSA